MTKGGRLARVVAAAVLMCLAVATPAGAKGGTVEIAVADDPANQLWDCVNRRVPFGDAGEDVLRCLTFRFDAPKNLESAVLYLDIAAPTGSLQDTDSLVVAVGQPFDDCVSLQGAMDGCVTVHGGFKGGERSLTVDLLNVACDPSAPHVTAEQQQAVRDAVASGVVHLLLQDDTAVNGGWLDINGADALTCGTSVDAVPEFVVQTARQPGSSAQSDTDGGGGSPVVPIVVAAGAIAIVAGAGTAAQKARIRKTTQKVHVTRVPDPGTVDLDTPDEDGPDRSVGIGVRATHDDEGALSMVEGP